MQIQTQNIPYIKEFNSRHIFNIAYEIVYNLFVIVFVVSGISKLYNPFILLESMRFSLPFPTWVLIALVAFIAIFETLLGLFLLLRIKVKENLFAVTIMSVFVFLYTIFCYCQNVPGDAGFFGGLVICRFNFAMIIEVSVIILISLALLIKEVELPD